MENDFIKKLGSDIDNFIKIYNPIFEEYPFFNKYHKYVRYNNYVELYSSIINNNDKSLDDSWEFIEFNNENVNIKEIDFNLIKDFKNFFILIDIKKFKIFENKIEENYEKLKIPIEKEFKGKYDIHIKRWKYQADKLNNLINACRLYGFISDSNRLVTKFNIQENITNYFYNKVFRILKIKINTFSEKIIKTILLFIINLMFNNSILIFSSLTYILPENNYINRFSEKVMTIIKKRLNLENNDNVINFLYLQINNELEKSISEIYKNMVKIVLNKDTYHSKIYIFDLNEKIKDILNLTENVDLKKKRLKEEDFYHFNNNICEEEIKINETKLLE